MGGRQACVSKRCDGSICASPLFSTHSDDDDDDADDDSDSYDHNDGSTSAQSSLHCFQTHA